MVGNRPVPFPDGELQQNLTEAMRHAAVHSAYWYALVREFGHDEDTADKLTAAYIQVLGLGPVMPPPPDEAQW
jgi:hypothetical protein